MFNKMKGVLNRQQGFTLIELLLVVAILGILAGVVIPNVNSFMNTSSMNAANTELENVKTASVAYRGATGEWPESTGQLTEYLNGELKATYKFDTATGFVIGAENSKWSGIVWYAPPTPYKRHGEWIKQ